MARYNDLTSFVIVPSIDASGNRAMLDSSTSMHEDQVRKSIDLSEWLFSFSLPVPAVFADYPQFNIDDSFTEMKKEAWKTEETQ